MKISKKLKIFKKFIFFIFLVLKSYFLKFNGRVQQGSPKNFQLIEEDHKSSDKDKDKTEIILQFGLINDHTYAMDFQYPLSPYQAFSICLTSLATKIVCE
jgi:tubby and related proteins